MNCLPLTWWEKITLAEKAAKILARIGTFLLGITTFVKVMVLMLH